MSTPSILKEITENKLSRVAEEKATVSLDEIKHIAASAPQRPSFCEALKKDGLSIIGEIKKASPSKGLIKADFNPADIAKEYSSCVDAISVLTEADYFLGSYDYLAVVSETVDLPILCKDFIADEYQIYKAKAIGASAILLIAALLDTETIKSFLATAHSLDLDALVETHNSEEAKSALAAGAKIIGINNRNLHTFEVDINTTIQIAKSIPDDIVLVSESGINTGHDIQIIKEAKINAILVGESFMRSENIAAKAKEFKDAYKD
ncbi:MAG: indole-3-glycerol phosphate synthase TrpC [Clostridia bacterium]|nr:indole-3-glycerol phosphate synthase TrpC [Clostridia bacterium]